MDNITIELDDRSEDDGLFGSGELWITVSGPDPLPDFSTIKSLVKQRFNRHDLPIQPLRYFPSWGGPGEPYEEMWIVRKVGVAA